MSVSPSVSALPSIARLLARGSDPARLISALHQAALDVSGATASVLLRPDPTSGQLERRVRCRTRDVDAWPVACDGPGRRGRRTSARQRSAARAWLARDRVAGTGRPAGRRRPACWCRWWAREQPRGLAAAGAAARVDARSGSGRDDRRRDGHRARPRAYGRRTGAPPRRPGSDGGLRARRRLDAHADARARGDVSWRRAAHGGRCRGGVAARSARAGAGPGGDIGPAARNRQAARSRPRI